MNSASESSSSTSSSLGSLEKASLRMLAAAGAGRRFGRSFVDVAFGLELMGIGKMAEKVVEMEDLPLEDWGAGAGAAGLGASLKFPKSPKSSSSSVGADAGGGGGAAAGAGDGTVGAESKSPKSGTSEAKNTK